MTTGQQIGQPLNPLDGGIYEVLNLSFSPDGSTLMSNDMTRGVTLWDVFTRQEIANFKLEAVVGPVSLTEDGNLLINNYGTYELWDLSLEAWIQISCERAGRNFTHAEWTQYFPDQEYRKTCEQWPLENIP